MTEVPFVLPIVREGLDPVAELSALRNEETFAQLQIPDGPNAWLLTRYDDVRAVLGDPRFSTDFAALASISGMEIFASSDPGGLGMADPPDHTRLRKMLTPEFTMRRLRRLIPRIETIVDERLDAMGNAGTPVDLAALFSVPIPSLVICELLGVPYEDRDEFQERSSNRFEVLGDFESSLAAIQESLGYLGGLVAKERANPGEGLLGMLVREHGDDITDAELAGLADGVLTGGHETTASMLSLGALVLLQNPDYVTVMRSEGDQVDGVVDELLRLLSVVQVPFPRLAKEDLEISGQKIAKGEVVVCSLSAANRDSVLGANMDAFDPRRKIASSHLAFGYGIHRCVGAELGRLEMRIAYPKLFTRFPGLRLDVPLDEVAYKMFSIVYGVSSLPVAW